MKSMNYDMVQDFLREWETPNHLNIPIDYYEHDENSCQVYIYQPRKERLYCVEINEITNREDFNQWKQKSDEILKICKERG